ncbi:MAG: symmetrical bis(5'-nucleosyl)-tetraphosphatase [Gammaproteobacteria bacterium]|nr:symmetrical bis(5'-nucleosyl)-tetraphosphatase [Gammaproteobacteria bacterium]
MSTWLIGDVQGCFDELQALLRRIGFLPGRDRLYFLGDLVNRGPKSLEVLRFVHGLGDQALNVLGNHDLHLLALWHHTEKRKKADTLDAIFAAPDADLLLTWLQEQPMLHYVREQDLLLSHAGLPPAWDLATALRCAAEVQAQLRGPKPEEFFALMYGNEPSRWSETLSGMARWRYTVNALTRLRFVDAEGRMDLKCKTAPGQQPAGLMPWFEHPAHAERGLAIAFGHWAALMGQCGDPLALALDTGCVWGHALTAQCLETGERISQPAFATYGDGD